MRKKKKSLLDLNKLQTYSLLDRPSKVSLKDFAQVPTKTECRAVSRWFEKSPQILAAAGLKDFIAHTLQARRDQKPILWGMGSHVIKTGLNPLLIDLMDLGFVSGIGLNGSALIHDFETAFAGKTSEDVGAVLGDGSFGMAKETAEFVNRAIKEGVLKKNLGLGESLGFAIHKKKLKYRQYSLFCQGYEREIPITVHLAVGTDIIHMHPECDPASLGIGSHRDFLSFAEVVSRLEGGVYMNFGSAVILPEVFLKSLTVVRNLGFIVNRIYTANFDFIQQYRGRVNVVDRPTQNGGKGYSFTGHHELLLPLVHALLKAKA